MKTTVQQIILCLALMMLGVLGGNAQSFWEEIVPPFISNEPNVKYIIPGMGIDSKGTVYVTVTKRTQQGANYTSEQLGIYYRPLGDNAQWWEHDPYFDDKLVTDIQTDAYGRVYVCTTSSRDQEYQLYINEQNEWRCIFKTPVATDEHGMTVFRSSTGVTYIGTTHHIFASGVNDFEFNSIYEDSTPMSCRFAEATNSGTIYLALMHETTMSTTIFTYQNGEFVDISESELSNSIIASMCSNKEGDIIALVTSYTELMSGTLAIRKAAEGKWQPVGGDIQNAIVQNICMMDDNKIACEVFGSPIGVDGRTRVCVSDVSVFDFEWYEDEIYGGLIFDTFFYSPWDKLLYAKVGGIMLRSKESLITSFISPTVVQGVDVYTLAGKIRIESETPVSEVLLFDLAGRMVLRQTVDNKIYSDININGLKRNGIYIVSVRLSSGQVFSHKVQI